jgi:large subunit ribosomal protein L15
MKEHELSSPGANRDRKRLGRGVGSGYGKTAGRGTKGQKARAGGSVSRFFQGGQNPIHKQLPYKRGFTNNFRVEYNAINLAALDQFEAGTVVTIDLLVARRLAQRSTWQDGERRLLVKVRSAQVLQVGARKDRGGRRSGGRAGDHGGSRRGGRGSVRDGHAPGGDQRLQDP